MHSTPLGAAATLAGDGLPASGVSCWACGGPAAATGALAPEPARACPACGLVFQPHRTRDELRERHGLEYFDTYGDAAYTAAAAARRHEAKVRLRFVQRRRSAGRLLEIGPAAGYFLEAAQESGFQVAGVEPSPEMAREAAARVGDTVTAMPVEKARLEPEAFDVACAWHVLEHLVDPLEALQAVRVSLREGGCLFVEVPNFASERARREGREWLGLDLEHHVAQYSPEALTALLLRAGFGEPVLETVPWAAYRTWPHALLSYGRHATKVRGWPCGAHPRKHDLLRAAATARGR